MPVVVTGAGGFVGRALVPTLVHRGVEVRGCVRRPEQAEALRAAGAKAATGELTDTENLSLVMDGAHTVCHLAGGLHFPDDDAHLQANLETVRQALEAAREAKVARFLLVSYPGASEASPNAYLRAKGLAEEEVKGSGLEHVVLRCTHIYGPGSRWLEESAAAARRSVATVIGPGTQRIAPVFVADVAEALAAADDRATKVSGTFGLQGPDERTADEITDLLAGRRRRKIHLRPATAARLVGRRFPRPLLEVLAMDSLADAPDAAAEFGIERTALGKGLAASGIN